MQTLPLAFPCCPRATRTRETDALTMITPLLWVLAIAPAADDRIRDLSADPRAQEHLVRALELSESRDDDAAIAELQAAYSIDPSWRIDFLLGRALRNAGRCEQAITHHQRVLAEGDDPSFVEQSKIDLDACGATPTDAQGAPPAVGPTPSASDPTPASPPRSTPTDLRATDSDTSGPQPRPSDAGPTPRDPVPPPRAVIALVSTGGLLVIGGVVSTSIAHVRVQGSDDAPTQQHYGTRVRTGQLIGGLGYAQLGLGAVLATVGAVLWARARRRGPRHARLSPWAPTGTTGLAIGGRW